MEQLLRARFWREYLDLRETEDTKEKYIIRSFML
jgi:hypothetical protein